MGLSETRNDGTRQKVIPFFRHFKDTIFFQLTIYENQLFTPYMLEESIFNKTRSKVVTPFGAQKLGVSLKSGPSSSVVWRRNEKKI